MNTINLFSPSYTLTALPVKRDTVTGFALPTGSDAVSSGIPPIMQRKFIKDGRLYPMHPPTPKITTPATIQMSLVDRFFNAINKFLGALA